MSNYLYKGIKFKDIQSLAYWIYAEDNKIELSKTEDMEIGLSSGRKFVFDLISENKYVLLCKFYPKDFNLLLKEFNVKVIHKKELDSIFKYIYKRYGRSYLDKFRVKNVSDFKRKVIEYDSLSREEFLKFKNKNVRFYYKCKDCNEDVFTTWRIIDHFDYDHLCKRCRKKLT